MALNAFAARRPRRAVSLGVWLLGAGQTIVWAAIFYVFAALLLAWERSLGWSKTDLTLGLTVAILAAAAASPVAGRFIDAGHGRRALSLGALFGAIALAGLAAAESPAQFVVTWGFVGLAQGFCLYEPCFSVVTRARGTQARAAITHITLMAGFASPLSFIAAAVLIEWSDWQTVLIVFAAATALLAAPMLYAGAVLLEAAAGTTIVPTPKAEGRAALQAALRRPQFWLIALAFPLMALNHGMLLNHIMPLLDERNVPRTTAILIASTIGPAQVAGRLLLVAVQHRVGTLTVALIAFSGVVLASLLLMASGVAPALSFGFAVTQGAAYGLTSIVKPAITADFLGRAGFGAIAGWLALPYLIGFAFAPHVGSLIWEAGGYDSVILAAGGSALLGVVCMLVLAAIGRRRPPGSPAT